MRGADPQQPILFSYLAIEDRIPANHPLRTKSFAANLFATTMLLTSCNPSDGLTTHA